MYAAMGIDNVDAILKPDPDLPTPTGPATENGMVMKGQPPKAFPMQDHKAHIAGHQEFMFTRMVQINPQVYSALQSHISEHIALMAGEQLTQKYQEQVQQLQQAMQQAQQQGNQQAMQQLSQQNDQLTNQIASEQAQLEAQLTAQLAQEEEARMSKEPQDPLVKLKQQEIDLKAMETQARLAKDIAIDSEKMDLERDKLEADTSIELMKVAADADKQSNADATAILKENMISAREAMKDQTAERIAKNNAKQSGKKSDQNK
jgi:hypothetical protein